MNTLANHDFVPHNGRNITEPILVKACMDAFNIARDFAVGIFQNGIIVNPVPNSTVSLLLHTSAPSTHQWLSSKFPLSVDVDSH